MAAITFTAVRPGSSSTQSEMTSCGATVAAGQPVYSDSTDAGKTKVADNNASAATAVVKGIALHGGVSGGGLVVLTSGTVVFAGASMTAGLTYYLGATAGEIVPEADLATGNYVTRLGTASNGTDLVLSIANTGIQRA